MTVFELLAKISLDTTEYDHGLDFIKKGAEKIGKIGAAAIGAATSAVTAFGMASVKTGMGFDSSMSQVAATLGKTVDEMNKEVNTVELSWGTFTGNMRDYAQEMGAKTAFSATQAADALNYMALAGYDTQKSMETLPSVLNLAAAGAMDLASASDMVTDAETALGLAGKTTEDGIPRTTALIDEMAKTASKTNTSVSQLGSAILTIGGTAKLMNGGVVELADGTKKAYDGTTELSAALGILADNGTKGSEAGTTLRNVLTSISGKKFAKTFGEMGVKAYDANGQMRSLKDILSDMNKVMDGMTDEQKTNLINSTFNARDLKNVNALLATTTDRWDEVTTALLDSKGAAEAMANTQLDNLAGDVTLFKSALEGAQIAISDKVTPSLRDFVQLGSKGLSEFTEKLKSGDVKGAITGIGASIGNAAAELFKRVPDMVKAGGLLIEGVISGMGEALSGGFGSLDVSETVLPLIVSLSESLRDHADDLVQAGIEMLSSIGQGFSEGSSSLIEPIGTVVSNLFGIFTDNAPMLIEAGAQLISNIASGLSTGIPKFLENALPMVLSFSEIIRSGASTLVDAGIGLILSLAQGIMDSLPTLLEQLPQIVINIAGVINDNAPKLLVAGLQLIVMLAKGIINAVPSLIENFPKIFEAIVSVWMALNWFDLGSKVITFIKNGIKSLASQIPNAIKEIGKNAWNFFKNISWNSAGVDAIQFILNGIASLVGSIPSALREIASSAVSAFGETDWISLGRDVISGIVSGITGNIGWIADAARSAARRALDAAKNFLDIHSPSRVFRDQVGAMVDKGFALGIDDNAMYVDRAIDRLSKKASRGINLDVKPLEFDLQSVPSRGNADGGKTVNNVFNIRVDGAESPEDYASRLVAQLELELRTV